MRATALNDADVTRPAIMDTEVGRLRGAWRGATAIAAGQSIDVELDLSRPRAFAEFVINPPTGARPQLLRGVVGTVFDDGVLVLQVGSSAVQVELEGDVSGAEVVGMAVGLVADDLEFHPSGI